MARMEMYRAVRCRDRLSSRSSEPQGESSARVRPNLPVTARAVALLGPTSVFAGILVFFLCLDLADNSMQAAFFTQAVVFGLVLALPFGAVSMRRPSTRSSPPTTTTATSSTWRREGSRRPVRARRRHGVGHPGRHRWQSLGLPAVEQGQPRRRRRQPRRRRPALPHLLDQPARYRLSVLNITWLGQSPVQTP